MRASYTIDANAADPFQQIGLTWDAVTCMIYNPTKFTALLRLGTSRPASTADAYLPVGPAEAIVLPVSGRDFVVVLSAPTLPLAPVGMPTVCSVTLYDAHEPSPSFGSIALTGQPTPADVLLAAHATTGTTPVTTNVPLPASLRAVTFRQGSPTSMTHVTIVGHDSGISYMDVTLSLLSAKNYETCDVYPALDTSIDVTVTGTANPYVLLGHAVPKDSGIYSPEGVPRVILWADPGNAASQIQIVNYDGTIVRPSLPLPVSAYRTRTPLALVNAVAVVGVGAHVYGPLSLSGWAAGEFGLNLTVGASVTMSIVEPLGNLNIGVAPASAAAPALVPFHIGPGLTPGANAVAAQLYDGIFIVVNHSTAAAASYTVTFYPAQ